MTDVFGNMDPLTDKSLAAGVDATEKKYRARLREMAAEENVEYLDMTTPWAQYVVASGRSTGSFKRDHVHGNDRGKQILGRILAAYFAPKIKPEIAAMTDSVDRGASMVLIGESFGTSPEVWLWQPGENKPEDVRGAAFAPAELPELGAGAVAADE